MPSQSMKRYEQTGHQILEIINQLSSIILSNCSGLGPCAHAEAHDVQYETNDTYSRFIPKLYNKYNRHTYLGTEMNYCTVYLFPSTPENFILKKGKRMCVRFGIHTQGFHLSKVSLTGNADGPVSPCWTSLSQISPSRPCSSSRSLSLFLQCHSWIEISANTLSG